MTTTTERRPRRRHPAVGARILAAGMATTAMLAMVAVLGYRSDRAQPAGNPTPATSQVPAPVTVVVYRRPAPEVTPEPVPDRGTAAVSLTAAETREPSTSPGAASTAQPAQIQLQPSVRTVVQAPASTRTNGSR